MEQKKAIEEAEAQIIRNCQGLAHGLTTLPIDTQFTPIAFTFRKTKHEENALLVLRMEDDTLYYGGAYFTFIHNKYKHLWKQYKNSVYGLTNFKPILSVKIEKYENSKSNNKIPKFKTLKTLDNRIKIKDIKEELEEKIEHLNTEINNIALQKLPPFKPSSAIKLEDKLETNKEYTITHLDTAHYRGSKQHFIKLKEYPNDIIKANQFLNNAFNDNPQHLILKFKTLAHKYNSNRNKELDIDIKKKEKKQKFNILLSA